MGRSLHWTQPYGDHSTYMIGALYFAHKHWRDPVFYVPKFSFPEGANIIFSDSIPLFALFEQSVGPLPRYQGNG